MLNLASQSVIRQNQSDIIIPEIEGRDYQPTMKTNVVLNDLMKYDIAPSNLQSPPSKKKPVSEDEDVIETFKMGPQIQTNSKPSRMSAQSQKKDDKAREIMFNLNSGVISVEDKKKADFENSKKGERQENDVDYDEDMAEFEAFLVDDNAPKPKNMKSANKKASMNVNTDALKNEILGKFKEANQPKAPKSKPVEKKTKANKGKRSANRVIEELGNLFDHLFLKLLDGLDSEEIELNLKAGGEKPKKEEVDTK
jgi:hypothetical protein